MSVAQACPMDLVNQRAVKKSKRGVRVVFNLLWTDKSSAPNADQICNWISQFPIPTQTMESLTNQEKPASTGDPACQSTIHLPTPTLKPTMTEMSTSGMHLKKHMSLHSNRSVKAATVSDAQASSIPITFTPMMSQAGKRRMSSKEPMVTVKKNNVAKKLKFMVKKPKLSKRIKRAKISQQLDVNEQPIEIQEVQSSTGVNSGMEGATLDMCDEASLIHNDDISSDKVTGEKPNCAKSSRNITESKQEMVKLIADKSPRIQVSSMISTSVILKDYEQVAIDDQPPNIVRCRTCGSMLRFQGLTTSYPNMRRHWLKCKPNNPQPLV